MRCTVIGCNQTVHWRSKSLCYYHWKVQQGLIEPEVEDRPKDIQKQTQVFLKYQHLVFDTTIKLSVLQYAVQHEDLKQQAALILWETIPKIDWTKTKREIKAYLKSCIYGGLKNYFVENLQVVKLDKHVSFPFVTDPSCGFTDNTVECQPNISPEKIQTKRNLKQLKKAIQQVYRYLNSQERKVLRKSLLSNNPPTLRELGKMLGVNHPERARRIKLKLIEKLTYAYQCMGDNE